MADDKLKPGLSDVRENTFIDKGVDTLVDLKDTTDEFELLPDHRELFKNILNTPDVGIGLTDEDELFVFANPAAERLFGVEPGTLAGRSLLDFLPSDTIEPLKNRTKERKQGKKDTYDLEIVLSDGTRRWLIVNVTPRFDEKNKFIGTQGIFQDTTEHFNIQKSLHESEQRYRELIQGIPFGVGLVQNNKVIFANRAATKMLGYESLDEMKSMDALGPISKPEKNRIQTLVTELISGKRKGPIHYKTTVERYIGGEFSADVWVTLIQYMGKPALQVFFMDVTERERAEAERIRLEESLKEGEKMQSVGRLAGGVAHDFNNLLTPILGYTDMGLLRLEQSDPLFDDLKEIRDAAEKARLLVQQLLAFSGKQVMQMQPMTCNELLKSTAPMLRRVLRENIAIIQIDSSKPININGDIAQLEQVLVHLALNASDAMPHGGELEIKLHSQTLDKDDLEDLPELTPGAYGVIQVRDTGKGMDESALSLVFEPFYTTKHRGATAGLGLATVHGIIKQHKGHISVESRCGVGTTFTIYLPLSDEHFLKENDPDGTFNPEGMVVLLVEDSSPVRKQVAVLLRRKGMIVKSASNAEEALEMKGEDPIDLLITDLIMPGMNGRELYEKLSETTPNIPTLFMSGYSGDILSQNGTLEGGLTFLRKPFTMDSLYEAISKALSSAQRSES